MCIILLRQSAVRSEPPSVTTGPAQLLTYDAQRDVTTAYSSTQCKKVQAVEITLTAGLSPQLLQPSLGCPASSACASLHAVSALLEHLDEFVESVCEHFDSWLWSRSIIEARWRDYFRPTPKPAPGWASICRVCRAACRTAVDTRRHFDLHAVPLYNDYYKFWLTHYERDVASARGAALARDAALHFKYVCDNGYHRIFKRYSQFDPIVHVTLENDSTRNDTDVNDELSSGGSDASDSVHGLD